MTEVIWFAGEKVQVRNRWGEPTGKFRSAPNLELGFFNSLEDAQSATENGAKPIAVVRADNGINDNVIRAQGWDAGFEGDSDDPPTHLTSEQKDMWHTAYEAGMLEAKGI